MVVFELFIAVSLSIIAIASIFSDKFEEKR